MIYRSGFYAVLLTSAVLGAVPAVAQEDYPAAAALGQCLTDKSTGADRMVLVRWFISSLTLAPQLSGVAEVKAETRDAIDRAVAATFTRLLTVDCLDQARIVAKEPGRDGFKVAGQTFGRIAAREVMGDPKADAAMGNFAKYLNDEDFAKLRPGK